MLNKFFILKPLTIVRGFLFCLTVALFILFTPWAMARAVENNNVSFPLILSEPVVSLLPSGRVAIAWDSSLSSKGKIIYGVNGFDQQIEETGYFKSHALVLDNLESNRLYHYKVVGVTADGQTVQTPHLLFSSHRPVDLIVESIVFDDTNVQYRGYKPTIDSEHFVLTIANRGDIDIRKDFFVSFLIAEIQTDLETATSTSREAYSCFSEVVITGGVDATGVKKAVIDRDVLEHCDPLTGSAYSLTVAVDYTGDIEEGNEFNNVSSISFPTIDSDLLPQFKNVAIEITNHYSADLTFNMDDYQGAVLVQYAPLGYYQDQGVFMSDRLAVRQTDGSFLARLKGLADETVYQVRLSLPGSNFTSDILSFATSKDPEADVKDLISMKRTNSACRIIASGPLGSNYWSSLGLQIPANFIEKYRIQWAGGTWSPWFVPGQDDIDWVTYGQDNERRVWAYFGDHNFEFISCQQDLDELLSNPSEQNRLRHSQKTQVLGIEIAEIYGQRVDISREESDPCLGVKKEQFFNSVRNYQNNITTGELRMLEEAYLYGGYSLQEIQDVLNNGPGSVHYSVSASEWRLEVAAATPYNKSAQTNN